MAARVKGTLTSPCPERTLVGMGLRFVLVVAGVMSAAGCERILGLDSPGREASDAGDDAPISDGSTTDGSPADMIDGFDLHLFNPEPGTRVLSNAMIDTAAMDLANCTQIPLQPAPARCLIYAQNISLPAGTTLTIHGTYPVMLVAVDTVDIAGNIVVTANQDANGAAMGGQAGNSVEGGGGAGGGYLSSGGAGGGGDQGGLINGGTPGPTALPGLHGGSRGGAGGAGGGAGGSSGGAMWILGRNVHISGKISANGFGGGGAAAPGSSVNAYYGLGGGGGGSGGYVRVGAIDSIVLAATGAVTANGGGGGEGSSPSNMGLPGLNGLVSLIGAPGGAAAQSGGNGGVGGALGPATDGYTAYAGGGGGGGGQGYVIFHAPMKAMSGIVSPAASP